MLHDHQPLQPESRQSKCRRRWFLVAFVLSWLVFVALMTVQFGCGERCISKTKQDIVVPAMVVSCGVGGFLLGIVYVNCAFWVVNPFTA